MPKGLLNPNGNRVVSVKAQGGLTLRRTRRKEAKAWLNDPEVLCGKASDFG